MAANAPENVRRLLAWQKKNPEPITEAHPKIARLNSVTYLFKGGKVFFPPDTYYDSE
jgi:hypothetical protein